MNMINRSINIGASLMHRATNSVVGQCVNYGIVSGRDDVKMARIFLKMGVCAGFFIGAVPVAMNLICRTALGYSSPLSLVVSLLVCAYLSKSADRSLMLERPLVGGFWPHVKYIAGQLGL